MSPRSGCSGDFDRTAPGRYHLPMAASTPALTPGAKAPDFHVKDQSGNDHRLADYAGQSLLLWFYPKADTPG